MSILQDHKRRNAGRTSVLVLCCIILSLSGLRVIMWRLSTFSTTSTYDKALVASTEKLLKSQKRKTHITGSTVALQLPPHHGPVKTLVILIGNLRCGELAWKSLYDNLLDHPHEVPHTFDLALAIGDTDPTYQNATLFQRARYYWKFEEHGDDWSDALDAIDPTWTTNVAPRIPRSSLVLGGARQWKGSGAISFWIRWFVTQRLMEERLVEQYDRFVISRTDHFYRCPHDMSMLSMDDLWIPFGEDYGGICDRHLIVSSRHVLTALNVLPHLFAHPKDYKRLGTKAYNPEALLRDAWSKQGLAGLVKRFPRMMFTCGNQAVPDQTRWSRAERLCNESVKIKYEDEYTLSGGTCHLPESILKPNETKMRPSRPPLLHLHPFRTIMGVSWSK